MQEETLKWDISVPVAYKLVHSFILYLLIWEMYAPINQSLPIETKSSIYFC